MRNQHLILLVLLINLLALVFVATPAQSIRIIGIQELYTQL